jgi:8-oxo-dGTP pyrophosphatase MutT (NUDIX family)
MVTDLEDTGPRCSARVLLVDGRDRVLLFEHVLLVPDAEHETVWNTVGGGIDAGETPAEAAARESREETGLSVPADALGSVVATTSGLADLGVVRGFFRDDFFFHRVAAHEVDISGFEPLEASSFLRHAWWSLADLEETTQWVVPNGLAGLLRELLAGRMPETPVELPWHH